ncbi:hypothetical protein Clacol_003942 [Clathrus columnatus]|uniref:Uncharacterized protein n=1 Tax=Clathrus columnatus TaxID=1419009 RepID=A0AAV5AAS8_9AGAM|nr:hypothetical protein Clacol_003942 [Clathrus columnatus]
MFSEDDLDSIFFGQPGDLSTDEFKYFDMPGTGISDAALPFHDESSLLFGNDQVASSSNYNVDLLGIDASYPGGLTLHVDIIDRGTSSNATAGSTSQNDRLQDSSFATQTQPLPNYGSNSQSITHTNAPQPSTLPYDSSLNDTAGFNIATVQPFTTSLLQNEDASLEGPTGPPRERQRSPSSSAPLGSCSTAQSNPSPNLGWNSIYLSTSSHTFDSANDLSYESVSSNTQTAVELTLTNDAFDAIQFSNFVDNNDASYTQLAASPTNNDVFDATDPLYSNDSTTPCIDSTQSAELQSNNYVFDLTEPEYFPSPSPPKQVSPLRNIEQQTPTNVPQPSAVAPQYFAAPSINPTPIPSYTQPANSAIQPENHPLKPSSNPANTQRLVFPNVAQSSTSSIQHYSSSLDANENASTPLHSRQPTQVPASQVSSESLQVSREKQRRVMNIPPPQSTSVANALHQYYRIPTPNENTPIPSQSRANQAPVNNLNPAFFSAPPQYKFNPGVQSHNTSQRSTNVPPQLSPASTPNVGRQYMLEATQTPQAQGPVINRQQMFPGPSNVPRNPVHCSSNFIRPYNFRTEIDVFWAITVPTPPNYGVPNNQHNVQQRVTPSNQDPRARQMHKNIIVNNDPSVAKNQRLNMLSQNISMTGYNGNSIVPNPQVPPTSGVPNVDPVGQQPLYPTPPTHAAVAQGGPHHPPSNNHHPHPIPPPLPTIPGSTDPVPPRQPLIHPWTQQPVYIIPPSVPKSRSTSSTSTPIPPSSTSDLVVTRPRKKRQRPQDDESAVNNSQKRSRVDRPAEYLYEEIRKGKKYACRYAGPAQPGGCKAPTFTSMSSLSTHIMLIHAKSETEMNLPLEQWTAYNGLPPSLRSVHVVCPLPDAELVRCKHYHEHGRRWEAHVMDTPEHAVHSHIASNHV